MIRNGDWQSLGYLETHSGGSAGSLHACDFLADRPLCEEAYPFAIAGMGFPLLGGVTCVTFGQETLVQERPSQPFDIDFGLAGGQFEGAG